MVSTWLRVSVQWGQIGPEPRRSRFSHIAPVLMHGVLPAANPGGHRTADARRLLDELRDPLGRSGFALLAVLGGPSSSGSMQAQS